MVALITGVSALPAAYQLNRGKLDTGASFNYGRIRKALLSKLRVYAPSLCTLARSISLRRYFITEVLLIFSCPWCHDYMLYTVCYYIYNREGYCRRERSGGQKSGGERLSRRELDVPDKWTTSGIWSLAASHEHTAWHHFDILLDTASAGLLGSRTDLLRVLRTIFPTTWSEPLLYNVI